uniref:Uncharacterized protein n=1 Tax=Rhizophora mucronata TaxID=61149 RepID=A0A2P2NVA3_RHIMU
MLSMCFISLISIWLNGLSSLIFCSALWSQC